MQTFDWASSFVVIGGIGLGLLVLWVIHRLISTHGTKSLLALEVVAFCLIAAMILLKHVGAIANQIVHPSSTISFEVETRDVVIIFLSLIGSYFAYAGVMYWLKRIGE